MVKFTQKGDFTSANKYFEKLKTAMKIDRFEKYGQQGVSALSAATPKDSGLTAASWSYKIDRTPGQVSISFENSNIVDGVPIAIILQYGHGTRNGGWVEGRDYINPAVQPIFDRILNEIWEEVIDYE